MLVLVLLSFVSHLALLLSLLSDFLPLIPTISLIFAARSPGILAALSLLGRQEMSVCTANRGEASIP